MFYMNCTKCGQTLEIQDEWIGMGMHCPVCEEYFIVDKPKTSTQTEPQSQPEQLSQPATAAIPPKGKKRIILIAALALLIIGGGITAGILYNNAAQIAAIKQAAQAAGLKVSDDGTTITGVEDRSITSVTIPDGITTIRGWAFSGCESLTSVTIPDSVTTIGDRAFCECRSLTSVTIPDGVTTIGDWAFFLCPSLTSVTIPDSVTSIGEGAFFGCRRLTSVTIPDSVTSIGEGAFTSVKSVQVAPGHPVFRVDGSGALIDTRQKKLLYLPTDYRGAYTIPSDVVTIGDIAFSGCESLTSVTIPDSVTTIGDYAFSWCSGLTSVSIPQNCEVGEDAFPDGCRVFRH